MHYLNYDIPPPNHILFRGAERAIATQLPKQIAQLRVISVLALTALATMKYSATIFYWPIVVVGVAYAGWTIYKHLLTKDPLVDAFYQIAGGRQRYLELPRIDLGQAANEKTSTAIARLNWDNLPYPIVRSRTLDHREVVIVKGVKREEDRETRQVMAFVEKVGPYDLPKHLADEWVESLLYAVCALHKGNTFDQFLYAENFSESCNIYCSISSRMANEFFSQVGA